MTIAKKVEELKGRWEEFLKEDRHYVGSCQDLDPADVWQFILEVIGEVEEEAKKEMFNLSETKKEWQETFYESDWEPDTLEKTDVESAISSELSSFLPRHMEVYDWNLPYIDYIILVIRKHVNLNTK